MPSTELSPLPLGSSFNLSSMQDSDSWAHRDKGVFRDSRLLGFHALPVSHKIGGAFKPKVPFAWVGRMRRRRFEDCLHRPCRPAREGCRVKVRWGGACVEALFVAVESNFHCMVIINHVHVPRLPYTQLHVER